MRRLFTDTAQRVERLVWRDGSPARKRRSFGFSLIDSLMAVAVLSLFAAITLPAYQAYRSHAEPSARISAAAMQPAMPQYSGPITFSTVDAPDPILPDVPGLSPLVTVQAAKDGSLSSLRVRWVVDVDGSIYYSKACDYVSETGLATFDVSEIFWYLSDGAAGNYTVYVEGGHFSCPSPGDPSRTLVASFTIEDLSLTFVNSPTEVLAGSTADLELSLTTTPSGIPVPDYSLSWYAEGSFFNESGLTTPTDSNGSTIISLTPTAPNDTISVYANGYGKSGVSADIQFNVVDTAYELTPGNEVPAAFIPPFADPTISVSVTNKGVPVDGLGIYWQVSLPSGGVVSEGNLCSVASTTNSLGQASIHLSDISALQRPLATGQYTVSAGISGTSPCRAAPAGGNVVPVATFGVETAELAFDNPPDEVDVGVPATFNLQYRLSPSNTPLPGYSFNWQVFGVSTQTNAGTTLATGSDGRTSVTLTTLDGSNEAYLSVENSTLGVFESLNFESTERFLDPYTSPPSLNYSEELANGFSVYVSRGWNASNASPDNGVTVTFSITSGNATFAGGGTQVTATSNSSGFATSPSVQIGRTDSDVLIEVNAPAATPIETTYPVTPSTYSLQPQGATSVALEINQSAALAVQALRAGSSSPVPLGAAESVTWSLSPSGNGALVTPTTSTDSGGVATTTFTATTPGTYEVQATFDSGLSGSSPAIQSFSVTVTAPAAVPSLVPYQGDLTRAPAGSQIPLVVRYLENGVAVPPSLPLSISWEVLEGDASVSPAFSPIDSSAATSATTVTFGSQPGPVTVLATLEPYSVNPAPGGGTTRGGPPPVTTVFYLEITDEYTLSVIEPSDRRVTVQPGEAFSAIVSLTDSQGVGIEGATIAVDGPFPNLPSGVLTESDGTAVLSASAPQQLGVYFVNLRYQPRGNSSSGQSEISDYLRVEVTTGSEQGAGQLVATAGDGQSGLTGQAAAPLRVLYTIDDVPTPGARVTWTVQGNGSPSTDTTLTDSNGIATFNYTFGSTPGVSLITAEIGEVSVRFRITAVQGQLNIVSGDNQSAAAGSQLPSPLIVQLSVPGSSDSAASLTGVPVSWSVLSGGGSVSQTVVNTDASGRAEVTFTLGEQVGLQQVRASANGSEVTFAATATAPEDTITLSLVSGNAQQGPIQTQADAPLVVELLNGTGQPVVGETVQWTLVAGDAVLSGESGNGAVVQSSTDSSGRARIDFSFGSTPGAVSIRASSAQSAASVVFSANAIVPGLSSASGNNQTGEVGQPLAEDFVVSIAPNLTKSLGGVSIVWEVISGGGNLATAVTPTDSNGQARNRLTLGDEAGSNQVRARVVGSNDSVTFNATATNLSGTLTKVSGDGQTDLPTNTDSAPLVIRLSRSNGSPISGATIQWQGTNAGFVTGSQGEFGSETTSTTNAQGEARIVARVVGSGPASVRAAANDVESSPVVFSLTGLIANTDRLNDNERGVAEVLDNACSALETLTNPTPAQLDLLQRCRELQNSAGENPDDVSNALSEMEADVGVTLAGAGLEVITAQVTNVSNYLQEARSRNQGGGSFKVGLATASGMLPLSFLPSAILSADDSAEGQDLGPDFGRWGFFASGQVGRGKYRQGDRTPDYDYSSGNLTLGADYRLTDSLILGAGIGFSRHDTDLRNDGGNLETAGWNLIGYGTWYNERQWFVDGVLSLGSNDYDLTRNLNYRINAIGGGVTNVEQVATASTKGNQLGFSLAVGRDWQKGPWSLNSYLRGNYLRTEYDAYEERMLADRPGSGLALAVEARELKSTTSVLGGKATYVLSRDWGILMPYGVVEWEHRFDDDPARLVTRFIADPTGTTTFQTGDEVDSDYFNVGFGLSALWPGGRSAYIAYERLVSASRLSQDTLSVGIRIEF